MFENQVEHILLTLPVQFAAARSSAQAHTNGLHDDGSGNCGGTLAVAVSAITATVITTAHTAVPAGHFVIFVRDTLSRIRKGTLGYPPFLCSSTPCADYLHL